MDRRVPAVSAAHSSSIVLKSSRAFFSARRRSSTSSDLRCCVYSLKHAFLSPRDFRAEYLCSSTVVRYQNFRAVRNSCIKYGHLLRTDVCPKKAAEQRTRAGKAPYRMFSEITCPLWKAELPFL